MKYLLFTFLLFAFFPLAAQTTSDVKDVQVAKKQLRVGIDTSRYFTSTTHTITPASTHRQAPTAKAVYDYVQTVGVGNWNYRNTNTTVGSANFTAFGSLTGKTPEQLRVLRNGMQYRVGTAGCTDCQVAYNSTTQIFTLPRIISAGELIQLIVYE